MCTFVVVKNELTKNIGDAGTLVSVIMPVYNTPEKFLRQSVMSVIDQSFKNWQLIIVDDGSAQPTALLCDELAAGIPNISVIHTPNGGQSAARNVGLANARGKYVAFVDSDDTLEPFALAILVDVAERTRSPLVVASFKTVDAAHTISESAHMSLPKVQTKFFTAKEALADVLYQRHIVPGPWAKLFSRQVFDSVKFVEGLYYEDLEIFPRLVHHTGSLVFVDTPVYNYRQLPGSFLHTWQQKRLDVLKVTADIEQFVAQNYPALTPAARDRRLSANFNIFILASRNGRTDVARQCWQLIRRYRLRSLLNPRVRLKNKAGILLSYAGSKIFSAVARVV